MIRKTVSPKAGCVRVFFELPACVWADRIFLVGDFNDWSRSVMPFAQSRDGVWQAIVDLAAGGHYEFRYLVDGHWQTDFHADGWATNEFGSQNSIVHAVLPPETFPAIGETSLLHEALREMGQSRLFLHSSHPGNTGQSRKLSA
ncbi:MAG: isoamylase early set domain-containing protein [Caldilineaceae bacterium]|nr:isoamylase early set domain-containing protein [Caldilineaceae bacterium]HRJ42468.1 isoamylase early set domain-containing protein [Caldilineaceae bacterium]